MDQTQNAHVKHTQNDDYDILVLLKTVFLVCLVLAAVVFLYFASSQAGNAILILRLLQLPLSRM